MNKIFTFIFILFTTYTFAQQAGSLDLTFGDAGKKITSINSGVDVAQGIVIQSDGKIIVVGNTQSSITGNDFFCIRYLSNGNLDSTFGNAGIVTTDIQIGSDDIAYDVALQNDGKIVLAGYTDNGINKDAALIRYLTNGIIDSSFGVNGKVISDYDSLKQDEIKTVKIHPLTGNIVVGGASIINSTKSKPVVARYLASGVLDTSFNSTGVKLLWVTNLDYQYLFSVEELIIQPNGKISATGWRDFPTLMADADYWLCRINSDGSMDNTFSNDGVTTYNGAFNGNDKAFAMILKPSNNFVISGGGYISTLRYNFNTLEFSSTGSTLLMSKNVDFNASNDDISYAIEEDLLGNYIIAGTTGISTSSKFAITKMNSSGTLDNNFGSAGMVTSIFNGNSLNGCWDMKIQSDNKIVAVGFTGNDLVVARYLSETQPLLDSFVLQSPNNLSVNIDTSNVVVNFSDAFGSTQYEIMLDSSVNFSTGAQTFSSFASQYNISVLKPSTTYYWKVRATDGTNWGNWTNAWKFTTKATTPQFIKDLQFFDINIYPNPASQQIVIESNKFKNNTMFYLVDINGNQVLKGKLTSQKTVVPVHFLSNGMYKLKIGKQSSSVLIQH